MDDKNMRRRLRSFCAWVFSGICTWTINRVAWLWSSIQHGLGWMRQRCTLCRVILLLFVFGELAAILWPKIRSFFPSADAVNQATIVPIANTDNKDRRGDVVFVHGLGGDGRLTWERDGKFYWPEELGKDMPDVGIWVLNYEAKISSWLGHTMPIENQSLVFLNGFRNKGIGDRRIIFIGHSLGGILIKQMLEDSRDLGVNEWVDVASRTKGVVFLGTPNTGSNLASLIEFMDRLVPWFSVTVTGEQLRNNAPVLMRLNMWYRNNADRLEVKTRAFYETTEYDGSIVVDQASADPGIPGIPVVGVPGANHVTICKPSSKESDVYLSVKNFIDQEAIPLPTRYDVTFEKMLADFDKIRNDNAALETFRKEHGGQEVIWDVIVRQVRADKDFPSYSISLRVDSTPYESVKAIFRPWKFDDSKSVGERIRIRGTISKKTSNAGLILNECSVVGPDTK